MKNINDVLKQKEIEYLQLQKEIEALRTAARLLADDGEYKPLSTAATATRSQASMSSDAAFSSAWDASSKKFP